MMIREEKVQERPLVCETTRSRKSRHSLSTPQRDRSMHTARPLNSLMQSFVLSFSSIIHLSELDFWFVPTLVGRKENLLNNGATKLIHL